MAAYRKLALEYPERFAELLANEEACEFDPLPGVRYVAVPEIAGKMRVSTMTVYRMINSGEFDSVRFGPRGIRVPEESFLAFLAEHPAYTDDEGKTDASG
jgi:excisionase family DNA binding protein